MKNGIPWTRNDKKLIQILYEDGYSFAKIACNPRLSMRRSRSAVAGQLYRLGLLGSKKINLGKLEKVEQHTRIFYAPGPASAVMKLTGRACRWPKGDPHSVEFTFCGKRAAIAKPYCTVHCKAAYHKARAA